MFNIGLRAKFFLYSNTLILVTLALVIYLAVVHQRGTLHSAVERRGVSLTQALAIPLTDALAYEAAGREDEERLFESTIAEILARNRDLMRYVVVTDREGRVTHSNLGRLMGQEFERALPRSALGKPPAVAILSQTGGERILEVSTLLGVSTSVWGSLTVGFTLEPVDREARLMAWQAAGVALVLLLGNSALTGVYVEWLIRPILNLHQSMKQAGPGDLTVRASTPRGDEVGELSESFNVMMDELERAGERDRARQTQMAHTEKMAAVGTLAAAVAHEVNNPLSGILTCIENMRENPDDAAMRERYLELIHDGLTRIEHTVENLLDFARERPMHLEPNLLNHNLRHVAELIGFQARKQQVEVRVDLDPDEPVVLADHFQMEQLFLNLVLNALQAMPDGGKLTLRTHVRGATVVAEVADTGAGIPEAIRERIFNPFFTTREVGEGTGLGLAVSDSIVASHGGTIEVETFEGKGSTFRLFLAKLSRTSVEEGA